MHLDMFGIGVLDRVVECFHDDSPDLMAQVCMQEKSSLDIIGCLDAQAIFHLLETQIQCRGDILILADFVQLVEQQAHFTHGLQGGPFDILQVGKQFDLIFLIDGILCRAGKQTQAVYRLADRIVDLSCEALAFFHGS